MSGDKEKDFVGIQRGGYGNPFDVKTQSGRPLAEVFKDVVVRSLQNNGYQATAVTTEADNVTDIVATLGDETDRLLVLTVTEWKTDIYMNMKLLYDLTLTVYDAAGSQLAVSKLDGEENIGGGAFQSKNSATAVSAIQQKIGYLFNTSEIKAHLQ